MNSDAILKEFWQDNHRFADLFNTVIFGGKQLIHPDELQEKDTDATLAVDTKDTLTKELKKYRDVVKLWRGCELALFGVENQAKIHYAMPERTYLYDAVQYEEQYRRIQAEHRKLRDLCGDEYLSGFAKTDRLVPVISLVVYYGEKAWDGAKSLSEMMDVPEGLRAYVADYKLNLFEVNTSDGEGFADEKVRKVLHQAYHLRNGSLDLLRPEMQTLLREEKKYLAAFAQDDRILKLKEEEGVVHMCTALDEMIQQGVQQGIQQGVQQGILQGVQQGILQGVQQGVQQEKINTVRNLSLRGFPPTEIADIVELSLDRVKEILSQTA